METDGGDPIVVMTTTPNKPADSYLGLLFCMEDMALCVPLLFTAEGQIKA